MAESKKKSFSKKFINKSHDITAKIHDLTVYDRNQVEKVKKACENKGGIYKRKRGETLGFCVTSKSIKAKSLKKK